MSKTISQYRVEFSDETIGPDTLITVFRVLEDGTQDRAKETSDYPGRYIEYYEDLQKDSVTDATYEHALGDLVASINTYIEHIAGLDGIAPERLSTESADGALYYNVVPKNEEVAL